MCFFLGLLALSRSQGHELSYLRAIGMYSGCSLSLNIERTIGVIILSAVLKRRMLLADKAKGLVSSLFFRAYFCLNYVYSLSATYPTNCVHRYMGY